MIVRGGLGVIETVLISNISRIKSSDKRGKVVCLTSNRTKESEML